MHVEKPNEEKKHSKRNSDPSKGNFSERKHVNKAEKELQRIVIKYFDDCKYLSEDEKLVMFNNAQREWKAKTIQYNNERPSVTIMVSAFAERVAHVYKQQKEWEEKQNAKKSTEVLPGSDKAAGPAEITNKGNAKEGAATDHAEPVK